METDIDCGDNDDELAGIINGLTWHSEHGWRCQVRRQERRNDARSWIEVHWIQWGENVALRSAVVRMLTAPRCHAQSTVSTHSAQASPVK